MPLPVRNATRSYWMEHAPSPLRDFQSGPVPEHTDVLIVGAGLSGALLAYWITQMAEPGRVPHITVLDAREVCGGATGRNGGHLRPASFSEYTIWSKIYGQATARALIEHEAAHLRAYEDLVASLGIDCDLAVTRSWDALMTPAEVDKAFSGLRAMYRAEGAEWVRRVVGEVRATRDPKIAQEWTGVKGCLAAIGVPGGRLWGYKLVHGIFTHLNAYPTFSLHAHTPAADITVCRNSNTSWPVTTPRGMIRARTVIHANNAWASHLLPDLRGAIYPARAAMAAIRLDGTVFERRPMDESVRQFWDEHTNNYYLAFPKHKTLLIGGAKEVIVKPTRNPDGSAGKPDLSLWHYNDREDEAIPGAAVYFRAWPKRDLVAWDGPSEARLAGTEGADETTSPRKTQNTDNVILLPDETSGGAWSAVMSHSIDDMPFVGALDPAVVGPSGQFIAAGWNGHGIPRIVLATAQLVPAILARLGQTATGGPEWARDFPPLPEPFKVTPERMRRVYKLAREAEAERAKAKAKL